MATTDITRAAMAKVRKHHASKRTADNTGSRIPDPRAAAALKMENLRKAAIQKMPKSKC